MNLFSIFLIVAAVYDDNRTGSMATTTYDTIVIGLGSAGCTAASTLAQAGKRVLALEAQGRIGGRVNTVTLEDGVIELGAEWIHGTENSRVYNLAIKNNVTVIPQDLSFEVYRSDGSPADQAVINELFEYTLGMTEDPPQVPEPFGQYATRRLTEYMREKHPHLLEDKKFLEEIFDFLDLIINNYEATNSWNDVTTESNYKELGGHQHMSWHRHGYLTFFEILLNTFNNGPGYPNLDIKLNTEVTLITLPQYPSRQVLVTCKDGTVYHADNVIVTVSLGVLKERHQSLFSTELPKSQVTAIEKMTIGVSDKIILFFDEPWWPRVTFMAFIWSSDDKKSVPKEEYWTTRMNGVSLPMGNTNSITFWIAGEDAKLVSDLSTAYTTLFSPGLPQQKNTAINDLSIGVIGKIVFTFERRWWPDSSSFFGFMWKSENRLAVDTNDYWTTRVFGASCPKGSNRSLTVWTCGDTTKLVETLPEELVKTKVMEVLRRFMGRNRTIPEPVSMLRSTWYSNPFTRGSYTYDNIQTPLHPNARSDLGQPVLDWAGIPRILFAGEATDPIHFSTVHGAADTGYREAMRLLPSSSKL